MISLIYIEIIDNIMSLKNRNISIVFWGGTTSRWEFNGRLRRELGVEILVEAGYDYGTDLLKLGSSFYSTFFCYSKFLIL